MFILCIFHWKRSDDDFFQTCCLKGSKNQHFKDEMKQIPPYFQMEYKWPFEVRKGLTYVLFLTVGGHESVGMTIEKK